MSAPIAAAAAMSTSGADGNRVDHRTGDRFNADKQWANGKDKLKWNPNKARQKQATGAKKHDPQ